MFGEVRPEFADPVSRFPGPPKFPGRIEKRPVSSFVFQGNIEIVDPLERQRFPIVFCEVRFVVKRIDLGNATVHKKKNDSLRDTERWWVTGKDQVFPAADAMSFASA